MRGLPILTFHSLDESGSPISLPLERFLEVIRRLLEAGHVGVDLEKWLERGAAPVDRGFAVTFDDGLATILPGAEFLLDRGVPFTIFPVTGRLGKDNAWPSQPIKIPRIPLLTRERLADLARRGASLGAHTHSHPDLSRASGPGLMGEVLQSKSDIESISEKACRLFAHPYGKSSVESRAIVGKALDAAFGTRLATSIATDDRFNIARLDAYYLRFNSLVDRLIDGGADAWLRRARLLRRCRLGFGTRPRTTAP